MDNEIDRKIDDTAMQFLLVQALMESHTRWSTVMSGFSLEIVLLEFPKEQMKGTVSVISSDPPVEDANWSDE